MKKRFLAPILAMAITTPTLGNGLVAPMGALDAGVMASTVKPLGSSMVDPAFASPTIENGSNGDNKPKCKPDQAQIKEWENRIEQLRKDLGQIQSLPIIQREINALRVELEAKNFLFSNATNNRSKGNFKVQYDKLATQLEEKEQRLARIKEISELESRIQAEKRCLNA